MFYTIPSFLVLFVFFLFIWEYTILKKEKNHKTLMRKMALQGDCRQKYRQFYKSFCRRSLYFWAVETQSLTHFRTKSLITNVLQGCRSPVFFRIFDIDDFCTKKTHKFSPFYWVYWMFLPKFTIYINQTL